MKRKFKPNRDYLYQPMLETVLQEVPSEENPECLETIKVKRDPRARPTYPCPTNQLATELKNGVPIERVNTVINECTQANALASDSNLVRYASQFTDKLKKRTLKEEVPSEPIVKKPDPTDE